MISEEKGKLKILGIGFVCADIIKTKNNNTYMPGGTCANVLAVLSYLGWNSYLVKANYNDIYNELIEADLGNMGVEIINFTNTDKNTPRVLQIKNNDKHKFYTVCPECKNKLIDILLPTRKDSKKLESKLDVNVFYYDRISDGIKSLNEFAKSKMIWTMYEPNSNRSYQQLFNNILNADIVKFSSDKIPQKVANKIKQDLENSNNNVKLIILTLEEKGVIFSYRLCNGSFSNWISVEGRKLDNIVDTSGAGDWLTAGFLDYFVKIYPRSTCQLDEEQIIMSLQNGQLVLRESCETEGALGALFKTRNCNYNGDSFKNHCRFCNL